MNYLSRKKEDHFSFQYWKRVGFYHRHGVVQVYFLNCCRCQTFWLTHHVHRKYKIRKLEKTHFVNNHLVFYAIFTIFLVYYWSVQKSYTPGSRYCYTNYGQDKKYFSYHNFVQFVDNNKLSKPIWNYFRIKSLFLFYYHCIPSYFIYQTYSLCFSFYVHNCSLPL